MDSLTAIMSTAEAVNVHAVGVRAWFLANRAGTCRPGGMYCRNHRRKDNEEDRARLRRYFRTACRHA
ncbi:hypothetical protein ACLB1O_05595 [Escherichia coli]